MLAITKSSCVNYDTKVKSSCLVSLSELTFISLPMIAGGSEACLLCK